MYVCMRTQLFVYDVYFMHIRMYLTFTNVSMHSHACMYVCMYVRNVLRIQLHFMDDVYFMYVCLYVYICTPCMHSHELMYVCMYVW